MIIKRSTVAAILLAIAALHAQAAETEITLSCDGTMKAMSDVTPEALEKATPWALKHMGLIANLAGRTVSFGGSVFHIDSVDATKIHFSEFKESVISSDTISTVGDIDRVTGALQFIQTTSFPELNERYAYSYDLLCKPTTRQF
jgi:hypothetical protein